MSKQLLDRIKAAGVVGAGGAGFPTHQKLAAKADTIVVNGAECEPLLRVDQQIMATMSDQVVQGLAAAMALTQAKQGIIALKAKYKTAIAALNSAIGNHAIRLHILDDFYPAGDEHVTVFEATERLIMQGGLPLQTGCIVINAETLINITAALANQPVTTTYLTITGQLPKPLTVCLPIGTAVSDALQLAGCSSMTGLAVIEGGPMMGKLLNCYDDPITKTTKGLIVLPENHPAIQKRRLPIAAIVKQAKSCCIRCARCTDLCPRYLLGHRLEPHKIMMAAAFGTMATENVKMALSCSECGLCEQYACIMGLSPRKLNASIKQQLRTHKLKPPEPYGVQTSHSLRPYRRVPVKRLVARLGLSHYDVPAPLFKLDFTPDIVTLKLQQHVGAPSQPVIEQGQFVERGQLVAAIPAKALGANIHASIAGIVTEITANHITISAAAEGGAK